MKFRKIAAALLTAAFVLNSCMFAAFAATAEQRAVLSDLSVQVRCTSKNAIPQETLYVQLAALNEAPLPEKDYVGDKTIGIGGDVLPVVRYYFDADNADESEHDITVTIGDIVYEKPGVYKYQVTQGGGSDPDGTYDTTAYLLRVVASWENGTFGVATAVFELNEFGDVASDKLGEMSFVVTYDPGRIIVPPENPTPELPDPPEPPPSETTPEPPPVDVSPGKVDDASLIQTGQLNWPIPVLAGAGAVLIAVGVLCLNRKDENA